MHGMGQCFKGWAVALLVTLSAAFAAGCGGEDSTGASTSSAALSKGEFVRKGNAACVRGLKAKDTAVQDAFTKLEAQGNGEPSAADFEAVVLEAVVPAYNDLLDDLSQLQPPSDDTASVDAMLKKYESALARTEDDPEQALAAEPFRLANEAAKTYGLSSCVL